MDTAAGTTPGPDTPGPDATGPDTTGLSTAEVEERRRRGLTNHVDSTTSRSLASIARANLLTLFNAILTVAVVVVLLVGNWRDAVFGFVMVLNAVIGIASEYRAKRTLDALAIVDAPRATALRDGATTVVPVGDLVLDDVVGLTLGDQVPVDGEVLDVHGLEVDESLLTGESVPVRKHPGDRVLAGTAVVAGSGNVRATAVGEELYAQGLTREAKQFSLATSEIQQGINKVLRVVSAVIVPVVVLMVWSQTRVLAAEGPDAWRYALVLAVAAVVGMIPQGLVLLTSMNFALGSATLARRGVLVQELPAVEVLARVDALCVDKTGTLTTGGIRVRSLEDLPGVSPDGQARARRALEILSGDRTNATACAIADALAGEGERSGGHGVDEGGAAADVAVPGVPAPDSTVTPGPATGEEWSVAFSSARKWSAAGRGNEAWVLGATEIVSSDPRVLARAGELAGEGLRVVCLSHSDSATALAAGEDTLPRDLGARLLVVLEEDLRPDAAQTLAYFREQGVHVRVISGDNPVTVSTIAQDVGLRAPDGSPARSCDARTLPTDLDSEAFADAVESHDVFGRVTPEQKRAMVRALQSRGHSVAMTGDGVNDALALKDADLGIAMGSGSAATKAVAQLVLVDGRFSVLPGVVAEGRRIIANMERVSALFLAKTTYASVIALLTALFAWTYPFLPRHFTYIDAFTIGIPAFFIALGPNARRYVPGFLGRTLRLAVPSGLVLSAAALGAYGIVGIGSVAGQTAATLSLMAGALWLLSITARPLVGWRVGLLALMALGAVGGVLIPFSRHFFALEWPAGNQWWVIAGLGVGACVLIEAAHRVFARRAHAEAGSRGTSAP
ncbi:HAD-IC family P-type ATPase [Actinomyces provencensis]|uniref:HAD-IC family P-type ATPase n=1 Tax=Actinomyces provencensis TaxID=1720198 RepID=UPI00098F003E|nr:HAD-IC family P-type ATPase [Actinomyces provencensis]